MPRMKLKPKSRQKNISDFIAKCGSENTAKSYRNGVIKFLDFMYGIEETRKDPTRAGGHNRPPDMEFYDGLALQYLDEPDRDYAEDLQDFISEFKTSPGTTRAAWKTGVLQWFGANKIYLHPQETRRIRAPRRPQTQDVIPTRDELRAIMDHADLQTRTLIMMLSSSGMRVGEALQLRWDDIEMKTGLIRIRGEITKTQTPRITFLSTEAMEILKQWKGYHATYIKRKRIRRDEFKDQGGDAETVFPLSYSAARDKFTLAMKKAGLAEQCGSTGRHRIHIHGLRKYFRTRLPQGGCSIDVVEMLMGHAGYLNGAYLRLTPEEVEREYRTSESSVWIYKEPAINTEELKRVEAENAQLRVDAARQAEESAAMKRDIEMLVAEFSKLKSQHAVAESAADPYHQ